MTIEEIRAEMRRKVVPENVIPQNIVEYLMDDAAELPELDAYTFLNRLRELGIGSADFEYLLEGCGAPAECVEKIKKNPAMNLQNLILTLESSGMTSHDYTIILYTARQIWERTLTLRIENTSAVVDYVDINTDEEPAEDEEPEYQAPRMPKVADGYENAFPDEEEDAYEDEPDEESKDEFGEPTLAEVLEQVKLLEKEMAYSGFDDEPEQTEEPAINYTEVKTGVSRRKEPNAELSYSEEPEKAEEQSDFSGLASDFSKVFDKIKETKQAEREAAEEEEEPYTQTMSVTKILAGMQKNHDEEENAPEDEIEADEAEIDPDEEIVDEEEIGDTSALIKIDQTLFDKNEKTVKSYDYDEDFDEEYVRKKPKPAKKSSKNYHIKSLIAAAVGAAALIAVSVVAFPAVQKAPEIFFAEKNEDIFTKIHKSYKSKIMGGETICEYSDTCEIFGDLLINKNGAMNFYDEKTVYAVTSEKISAESFDGTMLAAAKEILPPKKTSFVTAFQQDGALYCIFSGKDDGSSGKECGYMKVQNGTTLFTVRQDGTLSDFSLNNGTIALGSVYVPNYSRSFSAADTDVYLPRLGKDEKAPLSVENVAVSGTDGCSFAVCAEYKLESGENSAAKAVLGNPISASADYRAAFNGKTDKEEYGLLISYKDEISSKKCEKIKAAAFGEDFAVTLEGENANIRAADFTAKRGLANFPEKAEQFKIIGKNLLVGNENGFFAAFDCTNPEMPATLKLTKTNGIVQGDDAVLFSVDSGLTITYYNRVGNEAKVAASYRKEFTPEELKTLMLKGAETTAFADGSCGAAYEYFDGVSVVAQYVVFGKKQGEKTLYDDKTGFTRAFAAGGKIYAISSKGFSCVSDNLSAEPDT